MRKLTATHEMAHSQSLNQPKAGGWWMICMRSRKTPFFEYYLGGSSRHVQNVQCSIGICVVFEIRNGFNICSIIFAGNQVFVLPGQTLMLFEASFFEVGNPMPMFFIGSLNSPDSNNDGNWQVNALFGRLLAKLKRFLLLFYIAHQNSHLGRRKIIFTNAFIGFYRGYGIC